MDRRKFVKHSSLITAGTLLAPQLLFGCKKSVLDWKGEYPGKVIIVGAGAAGLYAGYLLNELGIDFTILEASSKHGGRMGKNDSLADFPLDLGAEWLHGKKSLAGELAKDSGTEYYKDQADGKFLVNGAIVDELPSHIQDAMDDIESSDQNISYWQYFQDKGATAADYNLVAFTTGELGATPESVSVKWENKAVEDWSSGNKDYKWATTYFDLINDQLAAKVSSNIMVNTPITSIDYSGSQVTLTDASANVFTADKVILALPLPVMKDGDIGFTPTLPAEKTQAFSELEMEAGMKIFIKFSTKFYETGLIGGDKCPAYIDESYGREVNDNVLLGFVMGDKAKHLSDIGPTAAIAEILAELDDIYGGSQASNAYVDHHIQDWYTQPYIRGAYSFSGFNTNDNSRPNAASAVDQKLYFAGEFTNHNGHHQTVHGAMETGYREVEKILADVDG